MNPPMVGAVAASVALLAALAGCPPVQAAGVGTAEAAVVVSQGTPAVLGLGKRIAAVPKNAAGVLYLPMGLVEMALAPLPGVSFGSGLRHTGTGLVAPFDLAINVLCLPHDLICGLTGAAGSVVPWPAK